MKSRPDLSSGATDRPLPEWNADTVQALLDQLHRQTAETTRLNADETPVAQLDPGAGKTKRAYLWAYRSNSLAVGPPIIVFDYQASRSGSHASAFLAGWRGHLMVNDYAGYKALFKSGVTELACLVHARRKFFDLYAANQNPIACRRWGGSGSSMPSSRREGRWTTPSGRCCDNARRDRLSLPCSHGCTPPGKAWPTAAERRSAIDYIPKRWAALVRYADSGDLLIDNNPVENTIRPIAIGKKIWLFAGSERAGKCAAAIQSLIGTARLNGLDPASWLRETLEKLPAWPNSWIDELLPLRGVAIP